MNAAATAATDNDDDNMSHDTAFQEFESEIARMSEDTDAILDSIREAVQTPTAKRRTKKRSLVALMEMHKSRANNCRSNNKDDDDFNDTDTDDDDMTDDGSVPEEVKQKIAAELMMADTNFHTDPVPLSAEIRFVSTSQSFSPMAFTATRLDDNLDQQFKIRKLLWKSLDQGLMFMAILVWSVVMLILWRSFRDGLLNDDGLVVVPILSKLFGK